MYRTHLIVQISDLHFGKNANPLKFYKSSVNEKAKQALRQAILAIEPRPDFIVVTGDVANRGEIAELQEGKAYLASILDGLWERGQVARCILVPGNHDVWRTTWATPSGYVGRKDRLQEWNSVFPTWSFLSNRVPDTDGTEVRPLSLRGYFQEKGQNVEESERGAQRALSVCEYFPSFNLAFLKLDSNVHVGRRPAHIARGAIGLEQRGCVDEILDSYDRATAGSPTPFADARRVALVHHHLTRLPNVRLENWMMLDDAGEVARWLARHGIRIILHGHFHWADSVGLTYWNTESNNSKVETIVVSAGSATAVDVDDRHNSCHYITMGNFRTNVKRPRLDNGEYQPLAVADSFDFVHRPRLRIEGDAPEDVPIFVEALEALVLGEEKYADSWHTYKLVKSVGYIDADRSYYGCVELHGENRNTQASEWIPFAFVATGAQQFEECECRVTDLDSGQPLPLEKIERRPIYVFPTKIYRHIPPGYGFRVQVTFRLKMVMLRERDYDVVSLLRFSRGVERIEFSLLSAGGILGPSLWELRADKLRRSAQTLDAVRQRPCNPPLSDEMTGYGVSIGSPSALAYLLLYERLS
jgi:3',5'-cyclic AMP phosphodiesterase CpdA